MNNEQLTINVEFAGADLQSVPLDFKR